MLRACINICKVTYNYAFEKTFSVKIHQRYYLVKPTKPLFRDRRESGVLPGILVFILK